MSHSIIVYFGSFTLRSLCLAGLAFILVAVVRSAAIRHAIWASVLLIMLSMPLADILLPPSVVPARIRRIMVSPAPTLHRFRNSSALEPEIVSAPPYALARNALARNGSADLWSVALVLYSCVGGALLLRFIWAYRTLLKLQASSKRIVTSVLSGFANSNAVLLYESHLVRVPLTAGFRKPFVLLPHDWSLWSPWKLQAVLTHEMAHIRRQDWVITLLAEINACVFWFNPAAWWVKQQLVSLAEKASDEASVFLTGDPSRYAEVLLEFAAAARNGQRLRVGGVAMAGRRMKSRIERVLQMSQPGTGILSRMGWAIMLVVSMPVLYAASALYVAPQQSGGASVSSFATWPDRVASTITAEERAAYDRLETDPERQHFIEQFWARRFPSWPDEVAYIIRDEERVVYQSLRTEDERQHFIDQFWARMDPSAGTPENEFKDEYYRRLEYASRAFAQPSGPEWWKTDRGRIYIMYGQPEEVKQYPSGGVHIARNGAFMYAFEEWRYSRLPGLGENVIFNFADYRRTGEFLLSSANIRPIGSGGTESNAIDKIEIRGNRRVAPETIIANIPVRVGDRYTLAGISSDIEKLYSLGYFDDIDADVTGSPDGGMIITFELREKLSPPLPGPFAPVPRAMRLPELPPPVAVKLESVIARQQLEEYRRGDLVRLRNVAKPPVFKVVGIPGDRVRADLSRRKLLT